ncbi:putative FBD-associated F-box protein At5g56820 [Coffea arabica]|uniref:FBD-associated F-box protein At5g56820 n=1 Tax=Coffea arabica TaxID=13443 RepID=A0ABM4UEU1_COFAR
MPAVLWHDIQVLDICILEYHDNCISLPREIFLCITLSLKTTWEINSQSSQIGVLAESQILAFRIFSCTTRFGGSAIWFRLSMVRGIDHLEHGGIEGLHLSIPTLRKLTIVDTYCRLHKIDIDAPHLLYLKINLVAASVHAPGFFNICTCESLARADLSLGQIDNLGAKLFKSFSVTHNIHSLKLSAELLQLTPNNDSSPLVVSWIQHVPNLEVLIVNLQGIGSRSTGQGIYFSAPDVQPLCLTQKLKEVQIRNFKGSEFECEFPKYLLQHGAVLERMTIGGDLADDKSENWPSSVCKKLMKFRRGSENCEVELN